LIFNKLNAFEGDVPKASLAAKTGLVELEQSVLKCLNQEDDDQKKINFPLSPVMQTLEADLDFLWSGLRTFTETAPDDWPNPSFGPKLAKFMDHISKN